MVYGYVYQHKRHVKTNMQEVTAGQVQPPGNLDCKQTEKKSTEPLNTSILGMLVPNDI